MGGGSRVARRQGQQPGRGGIRPAGGPAHAAVRPRSPRVGRRRRGGAAPVPLPGLERHCRPPPRRCRPRAGGDRASVRPGARRARRSFDGWSGGAALGRPRERPGRGRAGAVAPGHGAGRAARRPRSRRDARHPRQDHESARIAPLRGPRRAARGAGRVCADAVERSRDAPACRALAAPHHRVRRCHPARQALRARPRPRPRRGTVATAPRAPDDERQVGPQGAAEAGRGGRCRRVRPDRRVPVATRVRGDAVRSRAPARRPRAHARRRDPGRSVRADRHRVHRAQRQHLPEPATPLRRARGGDPTERHEHVGAVRRMRPRVRGRARRRRDLRPARQHDQPALPPDAGRGEVVPPSGAPVARRSRRCRRARRHPRRLPPSWRVFAVLRPPLHGAVGVVRVVVPAADRARSTPPDPCSRSWSTTVL